MIIHHFIDWLKISAFKVVTLQVQAQEVKAYLDNNFKTNSILNYLITKPES